MAQWKNRSWIALLACAALALCVGCSDTSKECASGQTDCEGKCVDLASDEDHCGKCGTTCDEGAGQFCSNKQCACVGDGSECDGACVNTATDKTNCGECGKACADGEICNGGNCTVSSECKEPKKVCDGFCADIESDNQNCGDCGVKCDETKGYTCVSSKCVCAKDLIECDGTCVNPNTAVDNCGECGNKCEDGKVCQAGKCEAGCTDPLTDCSGSCIDTSSDNNNCGACGTKCEGANGFICNSGACACAIGTDCGGQCVDTDTNGNHCGACGTVCAPGEACKNGACAIDCDPLTQCGNKCIDTQTDAAHCGACNTACTGGKLCVGGACGCPSALPDECSDVCTDIQLDEDNCGNCGNACNAGETCAQGACQPAQLTSLTVDCPETNVPQGMKMPCTATGILQSGQTADLTADPNLTWDLTNLQNCDLGAEDTDAGKVSNTPPTKGQFTASERGIGCTVDIRALYAAGTSTLTSNPLTLTIIERKLLSIAVSPDNPTVPYLHDTGATGPQTNSKLQINFKVVGTYDSGQVKETRLFGAGTYTWKNGNSNTANEVTGPTSDVYTLELTTTNKTFPTTTESTKVDVTYLEDPTDPNTARSASSTLTVTPGNATGASIQPSTATIPLGPLAFSLVVSFDNSLDFDVTDLCRTWASWSPLSFDNPGFTKHFQSYCPDSDLSAVAFDFVAGGPHSFLLHEVTPSSSPPQDPGYGIITHFHAFMGLTFPKDAPDYTSRVAELRAHTPTSGSPAVIEGNFWDGGYSVNRVFGRAQVTVTDAVLTECRIRDTDCICQPGFLCRRGCLLPEDPATDGHIIRTDNTNNIFPVGLMGHQLHVVGKLSTGDWKLITADVTYSSTDGNTVGVSNAVGSEGEADMNAVGTVKVTATDPATGVTCEAEIIAQQGKLCDLQVLPLYKGQIGRRARHWANGPLPDGGDGGAASGWGDGLPQNTHQGLNQIILPNEDDWPLSYKAFAWYSGDPTQCPSNTDGGATSCGWYWDSTKGEFESGSGEECDLGPSYVGPCCFKIDVTNQAAWSVVADTTPVPADPALVHQGAGAFKTKASNNSNWKRADKVKASFGTVTTMSAEEEVYVCGEAIAGSFLLWSHFEDSVDKSRDEPGWIGVGGKTTYDATTQFVCDTPVLPALPPPSLSVDGWAYRLQVTEDLGQWGSVSTDKATVNTATNLRGEITAEAEGSSLITAIWKGATQSLTVNIGKVAVASCEVSVPRNSLRHGASFGETMRGSITVTMTDGTTVNTSDSLKIDYCDNPSTDPDVEECAITYDVDTTNPDNSGSNYIKTGEQDPSDIRADGSDSGDTDSVAIVATCTGCGINPTTGAVADVVCNSSGQVAVVQAKVTGLHIQADNTPCSAGPLTSLTLNVNTMTDLKGCLTWEHGVLQKLDEDSAGNLTWSGGSSASPAPGGIINVNGTGSNTITATHGDSSQSADISIVGTTDPFTSLEIVGANIGMANCANQTPATTLDGGLQGCIFERMSQRFRVIGKRAGGGEQDLTVMTNHVDWTDSESLLDFDATANDPGYAAGADATDNGTFTDTTISMAQDFAATLCSTPAICNGPTTANVRVYDADPIQSTMAMTPSTTTASGGGTTVTFGVTAQPNGVTNPPDIDITNAIDFASSNVAAFHVETDGPWGVYRGNRSGENGDCLSMPVTASATSKITATLPQDAIGGTATALSTSTTLTVTP